MGCQTPGGECLVALSATLAAEIAACRGEDEILVLAAFLTALADNLALIAARRAAEANWQAEREARCKKDSS